MGIISGFVLLGEKRCIKGQWGPVPKFSVCGEGAGDAALQSQSSVPSPLPRPIPTRTFIYVMLLAGFKSNGCSESRKGESVLLGKTQSLIFSMIIFNYSAVFKAKRPSSPPLFIALIYRSVYIS